MKYEIICFVTRKQDGKLSSNKIIKGDKGRFALIPSPNVVYDENKMLRHPKNYAITCVIINDRTHIVGQAKKYVKGKPIALGVFTLLIDITWKGYVTDGKSFTVTEFIFKYDNGEELIFNNKEFQAPIDIINKENPKVKPKDIQDEECLSINEIRNIIGDLEDCGKDLINYVKKKLNK